MKELDIPYIADLVNRARRNDSDAFAELYALTSNKVFNYTRQYLRDDFLAQDAMQEVYILALKNIKKLNDATLFVAWLNRISFNVCYDMSKHLPDKNVSDPAIFEIIQDESIDSDPEAHYQKKEECIRLTQSLDLLPSNEKQALIMRYYNNMKLDEIANAMAVSRSSVKRYIAAGQKRLNQIMS